MKAITLVLIACLIATAFALGRAKGTKTALKSQRKHLYNC